MPWARRCQQTGQSSFLGVEREAGQPVADRCREREAGGGGRG